MKEKNDKNEVLGLTIENEKKIVLQNQQNTITLGQNHDDKNKKVCHSFARPLNTLNTLTVYKFAFIWAADGVTKDFMIN